ncbi:DUF1642 domain-containing protein [Listeria monocytogenes]|nr:DUF1642 domain-containing protein [Listeria monocytogenes]
MKFKAGDKVEFIYRNKKSVGEIYGVFPETQVLSIKQSDSPIDLLFSDKAVAKVEEQELVVVPQLVGDFLENHSKEDGHTLHDLLCDLLTSRDSLDENVYDWIMENNNENGELLARAWLDGYKVEKEPLYYVKLPYFGYVTNRMDYTLSQSKTDAVMLTESKIKRMDERYWQFAVPVEEVEGEA